MKDEVNMLAGYAAWALVVVLTFLVRGTIGREEDWR